MPVFFYIFGSVLLVSFLSLVGAISLAIGKNSLQCCLAVFIAFASGTLLSAAFLHMLPEAIHEVGETAMMLVLVGVVTFFFLEKFIHWHHCGKQECVVHPVAHLNLIGDGLHNFIDGVIIAAAYLTSVHTGVVTTIAIALHEIPQEFGDFSILIHSGMTSRKALAYNFLSASAAIVGALMGYVFLKSIEAWIPYAVAVAAGGFIYIATADLMPQLHKETDAARLVAQSLALIAGVLVFALLSSITVH